MYLICRIALALLSLGLIYASAAPLIHSNAWWIRIFDFPRIQISALILLVLTGYAALWYWRRLARWEYAFSGLLTLALIWQLIAITPYTSLYPKEMSDSKESDPANRVSLLIFNVLADNQNVQALVKLIEKTDPDMVLLSEPTHWWGKQLSMLKQTYPYTIEQPQENEYGMLLYSKLELMEPEVRFLIEPEVPSFRTGVRLQSGKMITLYGVHPRPPGISRSDEDENTKQDSTTQNDEDERQDSTTRDAELMLVAEEVKKLGDVPVIVAGDFNDVAWSRTTHLFQRVGGMLDPRVGRGLYNTFDTGNRIMRYPLDHAFASRHFLLVEMRRLPDIGSDHFPFLVVLDFDVSAAAANDEPEPDSGDMEDADEAINKGKAKSN